MAPRETENNAYAKFWGDKQTALCRYGIFWSGQLVSQLRACLKGSGGPQVGKTTRLGGVKK